MSVEFFGYSPSAKAYVPAESESAISFHNSGAGVISEALDLAEFSDDGQVWHGGSCTPAEFEARIMRHSDGHPDEYVAVRLIVLAQLIRDVRCNLPADAIIAWC